VSGDEGDGRSDARLGGEVDDHSTWGWPVHSGGHCFHRIPEGLSATDTNNIFAINYCKSEIVSVFTESV